MLGSRSTARLRALEKTPDRHIRPIAFVVELEDAVALPIQLCSRLDKKVLDDPDSLAAAECDELDNRPETAAQRANRYDLPPLRSVAIKERSTQRLEDTACLRMKM